VDKEKIGYLGSCSLTLKVRVLLP